MAAPIQPSSTNYAKLPGSTVLAGTIDFPAAPLEQVLEFYAELTGRTVLRPASLPATQITLRTQTPLTKDEAIQALDTVLALNGITMMNVGEKFVLAVPSNQALQEAPPFNTNTEAQLPEASQYLTKIVELKHILPSEAVEYLQPFAKMSNGLLPIDDAQILIIRDYAANVKRMLELLKRIDVEHKENYQLVVIPIKYGKVDDIYATMSSLISGTAPPTTTTTTPRTGIGTSPFGSRFGTSYGRYGIRSSTSRYGGYSSYYRGGFYPQQARTTTGRSLTGSTTFAQRLQRLLRQGGKEEVQLLQNARIVPDQRSNSLIVYASKDDIAMITNLVAKVDRLQAQVLIEAIIMEVQLTGEFDMGVSTYLRTHMGKWSHSLLANPGSVFTTVTNLASGNTGLGWIAKYKDDLTIVAKAITSTGKGQILAMPRIQTTHATPAVFTVGQTVPYVTSVYYGGSYYGPSSSFSQREVGTELSVTPYITDGLVVMEIEQHVEEITGFKKFENVGELPETINRSASATVAVRDGDTIILGGYIRASHSRNSSGVPILKDIPLLGALFRSRSTKDNRNEMVILLRPTILPTPTEAAAFANQERKRLPGISQLEEEMPKSQQKLRDRAARLERP